MTDIAKLSEAMPDIAKQLGETMVNESLPLLVRAGLTLDQANISNSLSYLTSGGMVKVTLSISVDTEDDGNPDDEEEEEDEEDEEG